MNKKQWFYIGIICVLLLSCMFFLIIIDTNQKLISEEVLLVDACNQDKTFCKKDVMLIHGKITNNTIKNINSFIIETNTDSRTICFHSNGGSVDNAYTIASWIKENKYNTCLADIYVDLSKHAVLRNTKCNSACPFILVMGKVRTQIGKKQYIKIHHPGINIFGFKFDYKLGNEFPNLLAKNKKHIQLFNKGLNWSFESEGYELTKHDILYYEIFNEFM